MSIFAACKKLIFHALFITWMLLLTCNSFFCNSLSAQTLAIKKVVIEGNSKTKGSIVLRELLFREGDTLSNSNLPGIILQSRLNLLNTSLFNIVSIDTAVHREEGKLQYAEIHIHLLERWYIWPVPILQITDRNVNSWLKAGDFTRVNAGMYVKWNNFTGRMDMLGITAVGGKNQNFSIMYANPYIDRNKKIGVGITLSYGNNREVGYLTRNDKMIYAYDSKGLNTERDAEVLATLRNNIFTTHKATVGFTSVHITDSLMNLNPAYFYSGVKDKYYFYFNYKLKIDHRDIQYYPLTGWYADLELNKKGFGMSFEKPVNAIFIKTTLRYFQKYTEKWYSGISFMGKISGKKTQPYLFTQGLGFDREMVRGYELNVIDGEHFAVGHSTVKFALIPQRNIDLPVIHTPKFSRAFFAMYLTAFADAGYVWNSDKIHTLNHLPNSFLLGTGMGIDMVTYYDKVMRIEYSINRSGKSGVFISFISGI